MHGFTVSESDKSVRCYMFDFYVKINTHWRYDELGVLNICNDLKERFFSPGCFQGHVFYLSSAQDL